MAFRHPTLTPTARQSTAPGSQTITAPTLPTFQQAPDQSQEWILFPTDRSNAQTETTSTECTPRTAGLSRYSDLGSLNHPTSSVRDDCVACEATLGSVDEDDELDGLDEGLQAFQEPPFHPQSGLFGPSGSILPRHDGLGTFPASSTPVQEQLWHFERYNPRKRSSTGHQRRRSSVQRRLDAAEIDYPSVEAAKTERIEGWRLEQSKLLLNEIEKQTRRRRTSNLSRHHEYSPKAADVKDSVDEHSREQEVRESANDHIKRSGDTESFLQRLTRRVVRDFIGVDDSMLSVIFGESLPLETASYLGPPTSPSTVSPGTTPISSNLGWEKRLLDRITRELGILLQHFSHQPVFLSSPSLLDAPISEYAGIPITQATSSRTQPRRTTAPTSPSFEFKPTLPSPCAADTHHASLWGIEEELCHSNAMNQHKDDDDSNRDYWEQAADLPTVFHYLQTRFTSSRVKPASPSTTNNPPHKHTLATRDTPESLCRAAVIRQYHPLVSRGAANWESRHGGKRRSWLYSRRGSSWASASLRRSRTGTSISTHSHASSRNFWDIGRPVSGEV